MTASITIKDTGKYNGSATKKYSILPTQQAAPQLTVKTANAGGVE